MRSCPGLAVALLAACLLNGPALAAASRWRATPLPARARSLKQATPAEPACVADEGTELVGGDFDLVENGSSDECCTLCSSTPGCTAWTFYGEDNLCILKNGSVTSNPNPIASSGVIRGALTSIALPDTSVLASGINLDTESSNTTCLVFNTDEADWVLDDGSSKTHGAEANPTLPPPEAVEPLEAQICSDPEAAGAQLASAIAAGGEGARAWTYALFSSECDDEDAATGAYGVAVDLVNPSGDPAAMEAVSSWFTNLANAANSVGIPLCASIALIDAASGTLLAQRDFPTGVQ